MLFEAARVAGVIVLLGAAACLATPPGKLPLALRGIRKILRRDSGTEPAAEQPAKPSCFRRFTAFLLVLAATILALV